MIMFRSRSTVLMAARRGRPMLVTHRLGTSFRSMIMFRSRSTVLMARRVAGRVLMAHALVAPLGSARIFRSCAGSGD
jgi:hypothetical protein